jgi:GLPGLI family protein
MKNKVAIFCFIATLGLIIPQFVNAGGGKFEGVITYNITFPNSTIQADQLAMFPKTMTLSIKGTNTRNESTSAMGAITEITNYDQKFAVSLLQLQGKKLAIKKTLAEINQDYDKEPKPDVKITGETKEIAGYKCKKAIVTIEKSGKKTTYEIWFTNELGGRESNFGNPVYRDIEGMLMEFSMQEKNFTMKYSAVSVSKKSLPDSDFAIPADYKLTTKEELRSMFSGGGM